MCIIFLLLIGYACLAVLAMKRGHRWKDLMVSTLEQVRTVSGLPALLLLLGAMTASWRASGTLALLVTVGAGVMEPRLFLLITFFGTAAVGYLIGTSFGVAGIMGAVFLSIGAAGGVNPALTAGAVLSGVYFGDRTSPVSSSFVTIRSLTGLSEGAMLRCLLRDGWTPFLLCGGIYAVLSLVAPLQTLGAGGVNPALGQAFSLSPWALVPAAVILLVPVIHVDTWVFVLASTGLAGLVAVWQQGMGFLPFLKTCLTGYRCPDASLGGILDGGGMTGMVEVCLIVCVSAMLSAALQACDGEALLNPLLKRLSQRIGLGTVTTLVILLANGIFCNQTVPLYLADTCLGTLYDERKQMTIDFSDANILSGIIPWNIACSVPLALIGADGRCLPLAFFLYLTPLSNLIRSKILQKRTKILQL